MAEQPGEISIRTRGRLPHWESSGANYFVTFRLADSLPRSVLESSQFERQAILRIARQAGRELTQPELKRLDQLFSERIDRYLDSGAGACHLGRPEIAGLVAAALQHFDGKRYCLEAWCIMPNHVHVLFRALPGYSLERILHSWKSFTATRANRMMGLEGAFWQREYYDRLVRNRGEWGRFLGDIVENPARANLRNWQWVWTRE